jgi:hypothetical protein
VSISTADIGPKVRKLPIHDKDALITSGRKGAEAFLKTHP